MKSSTSIILLNGNRMKFFYRRQKFYLMFSKNSCTLLARNAFSQTWKVFSIIRFFWFSWVPGSLHSQASCCSVGHMASSSQWAVSQVIEWGTCSPTVSPPATMNTDMSSWDAEPQDQNHLGYWDHGEATELEI